MYGKIVLRPVKYVGSSRSVDESHGNFSIARHTEHTYTPMYHVDDLRVCTLWSILIDFSVDLLDK